MLKFETKLVKVPNFTLKLLLHFYSVKFIHITVFTLIIEKVILQTWTLRNFYTIFDITDTEIRVTC